ncbi:unnamed protein product [marine sediment metagenome]|uniref:Gfo/Idh/MocA-like oxidoreductase N-terminal domain-containing protein n=1 Tax=marine sediment metagenome TaxID=412755 RepID=X1ARH8_9ZZZZ
MNKINVAVIGVGNIGKHHARIYHENDKCNLLAICDRDRKRAIKTAKKYNCSFFTDYEEMFNEKEINAVSIAVPTFEHEKVALKAFEYECHTLIEKPIAYSIKSAKKIINEAKKKNLILMIGHVERFNPAVIKAKRIIEKGEIGNIISMNSTRVGLFPPTIDRENVIFDLAIHEFDIYNFILNKKPQKILAMSGSPLNNNIQDYAEILINYGDTIANIHVNWLTPVKIRKLCINGSKGYLELDYINQEITIYKTNLDITEFKDFKDFLKLSKQSSKKNIAIKYKEPLKEEIKNFLASIKNKQNPLISGEEGLSALEIAIEATKCCTNFQ